MTFNILKYRKHLVGQNKLTVEHIKQLTYMMQFNGIEKELINEEIQEEWCDAIESVKSNTSIDTSLRENNKSKTSRK